MYFRYLLPVLFCALSPGVFAQINFVNQTNLLTPAIHQSGIPVAVLDMNGDGRDDIVRLNLGIHLAIEYQTAPGMSFGHRTIGSMSLLEQWGMCAADIDNNGRPDILVAGAYDGIRTVMANADGSAYHIVQYDDPPTFAQAVNFAGINADNWLDAFICNDDGTSQVFLNTADSQGTLAFTPQAMPLATVPVSDDSGNYGSVWCDVDNDNDPDLYISKCRAGVTDPADGRRINQLFRNNNDGTYTQDTINTSGLRIGAQSWASDFGDIDNDGDFDCFVINHYEPSQLLENDGSGHFTDISATAFPDSINGFGFQAIFRDFDNDGFVDILFAGTRHYLLRNNGDKTFSSMPILDAKMMRTFALGDLNGDGFQDIYAGYAASIPDALWLNAGNGNHFFGLTLRGVQSNRSAVGAKVLLYSALGTQVREVRSGESYGIMNSLRAHFGMGQTTGIDSVVIRWPSGTVDVLHAPAVDQYIVLEEGGCIVPPVRLEADGNTFFCSGDSVTLAVQQPYTAYIWNTGAVGAALIAKTSGLYEVTVTTAAGCTAVSEPVHVTVLVPDLPVPMPDTVAVGGAAILTATGNQPIWYDAQTGGMPIDTGNTFGTPPLAVTTTYWVANNAFFETPGYLCLSERVPVTAVVDTTLVAAPELNSDRNLRIYPNPAAGAFQMEWASFAGGDLRLTLRNSAGTVVWARMHRDLPSGPLAQNILVGDWPAGVYWFALETKDGVTQRKVVLQP
jgi:hypothetical protein